MSIASEGYRFILSAAVLALLAFAGGMKWLGALFGVLTAAFVSFFRDPERISPPGEGLILAPADGKIVAIREENEGSQAGKRVSIFLSPLDVHVNRAPVKGTVNEIRYQRGSFLAAYKDKASQKNERNALKIVDSKGRSVGVVQIAGVVARRIVCYVRKGDFLERGQRLGMIMFGSRVDVYLPAEAHVDVAEGQRVKGGQTIIGRFA